MSLTLGARSGQLASTLKVLCNVTLMLMMVVVPANLRAGLGLARQGTLVEWLVLPALLGLTIFYFLLLAGQFPRRWAYVVAVLESSSTALIATLYALTHGPLNPWIAGLAVCCALTAALFWVALADS